MCRKCCFVTSHKNLFKSHNSCHLTYKQNKAQGSELAKGNLDWVCVASVIRAISAKLGRSFDYYFIQTCSQKWLMTGFYFFSHEVCFEAGEGMSILEDGLEASALMSSDPEG